MSNAPSITLEGRTLPLTPHTSPKGNVSHVLCPKGMSTGAAFRGVKVGPISPDLPLAVTFGEDTVVPLREGRTESGNRKRSGSATVEVDGEPRTFTFQASIVTDGSWWLICKAIPQGQGGRAVVSLDEF